MGREQIHQEEEKMEEAIANIFPPAKTNGRKMRMKKAGGSLATYDPHHEGVTLDNED